MKITMRSKSKLLEEMVEEFLQKTAQTPAPNLTPEQVQSKLKEMDTQDLLENVEKTIVSDLNLKNVQPTDLIFRQFNIQTTADGKKYLNYSLAFSPNILAQVKASVAANKAAYPNFMLSNYILNVIQRLNPGMQAKGVVQLG